MPGFSMFSIMIWWYWGFAIVVCGYVGLILFLLWGWLRLMQQVPRGDDGKPPIDFSIVIAFRNEQTNLEVLVDHLKSLQCSGNSYEVILVDDHSTDDSLELAKAAIRGLPNFKVVQSVGHGKKEAIRYGVSKSQYTYVVVTDADCVVPSNWLCAIWRSLSERPAKMLVGPVRMKGAPSFLNFFQEVDFFSLSLAGAGAVGVGQPIMCNGANLVFERAAYEKAHIYLKTQFLSGDDVFLLHAFKKLNFRVDFLDCPDGMVETGCERSWLDVVKQRARWASKSAGYSDSFSLFVAWVVLLSNLFLVINAFMSCWYPIGFLFFLGGLFVKASVDLLFFMAGKRFYGVRLPLMKYFLAAFMYPFFTVFVVLYALLVRGRWKNRSL